MFVIAVTIWMRVKGLNKRLRSFTGYALLLIAVVGILAGLFTYSYNFSSIDLYNSILSVLIILSIVIMIAVLVSMTAVLITVRKRRIHPFLLIPVKIGMKLVMPFALFVTGLFKKDKDLIRSLFIDINNLFVKSGNIQKTPDKIMLLLPHCLQNSECNLKITGDIANCRKCGKCTIGAIRELSEEKGVRAIVVTGGTAARNAIVKEKPELVLSVACERDLAIGISDVTSVPVIGVLNQRPNGPCVNTTVDVERLREKLDDIIEA
jgi:hypothetical protein